jgi:hypothetical protein
MIEHLFYKPFKHQGDHDSNVFMLQRVNSINCQRNYGTTEKIIYQYARFSEIRLASRRRANAARTPFPMQSLILFQDQSKVAVVPFNINAAVNISLTPPNGVMTLA